MDAAVLALLAMVDTHAAELYAAEEAAAETVTAGPQAQLAKATGWLARTWITKVGPLTAKATAAAVPEILNELAARIGDLNLDPGKRLTEAANRALALGIKQGYQEIGGVPDGSRRIRSVLLSADTRRVLEQAGIRARVQSTTARLAAQRLLVRPELSHIDAASVLAMAQRAVNSNRDTACWAVNRANNQGIDTVARQLEADTIWISERDACVVCISLSGRVCAYGQPFPADSTFGDRPPSKPWPGGILWYPPRHPSCRCSTRPVFGYTEDQERAFAEALKREARRSVVRGFSLPSESEGVRIRAADRLLQIGANLPRTVEEYGRRAVQAGRFPNRSVPTGRG